MPKTVCIDFDGVINSYREGFQGRGVFEEPTVGVRDVLQKLKAAGWRIIVHTCRSETDLIADYMKEYELAYSYINHNPANIEMGLSLGKPTARVYVDDRAVPFRGSWKGMFDRITNAERWTERQYQNPFLDLEICGYRVDQFALYVPSVDVAIAHWGDLGYKEWTRDIVKAHDRVSDSDFEVYLAFNYEALPVELELLEVLDGKSAQFQYGKIGFGLSHLGFHVDDMEAAIEMFLGKGYGLLGHCKTITHTSCPYLYEYAYMNTCGLGFIAKLIRRVS